jgi:Holliday junction resolvasome RuvABC endonuclease subunit
MRSEMEALLDHVQPAFIAYEDYALGSKFGKKSAHTHSTGELGGVYKTLFWERGIGVILVPPTSLKLIITGSGKGGGDEGKAIMKAAIANDFGFIVPQSDEADACGLMLVGELKCGINTFLPDQRKLDRQAALRKCGMVRGRMKSISAGRIH